MTCVKYTYYNLIYAIIIYDTYIIMHTSIFIKKKWNNIIKKKYEYIIIRSRVKIIFILDAHFSHQHEHCWHVIFYWHDFKSTFFNFENLLSKLFLCILWNQHFRSNCQFQQFFQRLMATNYQHLRQKRSPE